MKTIVILITLLLMSFSFQTHALTILEILGDPSQLELEVNQCQAPGMTNEPSPEHSRYQQLRKYLSTFEDDIDASLEVTSNSKLLNLINESAKTMRNVSGQALARWQLLFAGFSLLYSRKNMDSDWGKKAILYIKKSMDTHLNADNLNSFAMALLSINDLGYVKRKYMENFLDIDLDDENSLALTLFTKLPLDDRKKTEIVKTMKSLEEHL